VHAEGGQLADHADAYDAHLACDVVRGGAGGVLVE
jgi:hypothetical protein